jgi:hypothetical protein
MLNEVIDYTEPDILPSVEQLIDFLENNEDWLNPTRYFVLEYFPKENEDVEKYKPTVYELLNIRAYLDDNVIYSSDELGVLLKNKHTLLSFRVQDIIYIAFQTDNNMITISFDNGFIRLFY